MNGQSIRQEQDPDNCNSRLCDICNYVSSKQSHYWNAQVMANGGLQAVCGSHTAVLAAKHYSVPVRESKLIFCYVSIGELNSP